MENIDNQELEAEAFFSDDEAGQEAIIVDEECLVSALGF